jgi:hypothetical protein
VYDTILGHLLSLDPVHEDAVGGGVFLKPRSQRSWPRRRPIPGG